MRNEQCPRPDKIGYPTRNSATRAMANIMRKRRRKFTLVRAYHCDCGQWHVAGAQSESHKGGRK